MNRHIGVGDSKNVGLIVIDILLTGLVIWRMRRHVRICR